MASNERSQETKGKFMSGCTELRCFKFEEYSKDYFEGQRAILIPLIEELIFLRSETPVEHYEMYTQLINKYREKSNIAKDYIQHFRNNPTAKKASALDLIKPLQWD